METAIYCRVSTDEQATEGFSIRAQQEKLKSYISAKSWAIYDIYLDEGISGKNITERPAINRMIEDIKAGNVKNVLVFKLDRLTRSVADLVELIDLFKEYDCAFNSLSESIDTSTASGRMFLKIIGIFAEFERENIGERVRLGKERKAREGYTTAAAFVSYGYDREKGERVQTVNKAESEIVKRVFDMYVNQNMSLRKIACTLNEENITRKKGNPWNAWMVGSLLQNCNYIGKVRYSILDENRYFESEGRHEPIISEEIFKQAQELMVKTKAAAPTKRPTEKNYFYGFMFCGLCGRKMKSHIIYDDREGRPRNKPQYNFECLDRIIKVCNSKRVSALKVETAVIDYMNNIPETVSEPKKSEKEKAKSAARIKTLNEKVNALDVKEKRVLESYLEDSIDTIEYRDIRKQLVSEKEKLLKEIEELTPKEKTKNAEPITREEIVTYFKNNWSTLNDVEKRQFLLKHISKIMVINHPMPNTSRGRTEITDIIFNTD